MEKATREEHEKILKVMIPKLENIAYTYVFLAVFFGVKIFLNSLLASSIQISFFDIIFILIGVILGGKYFSTIIEIKKGNYLIARGLCDKTFSRNKRAYFTDFKTGVTSKHLLCTTKEERLEILAGRECILYRVIPGLPGHHFLVLKD